MSKDKRLLKEEDIEETQKKYAEHLSDKTGETTEAIERGREEFLRRSAEALPDVQIEQFKPPYGSMSWYERFLEIAKSQRLDTVDSEFIEVNIVGSNNQSKVLRGLKFLGLVDEKDKATMLLHSLRVIGDEFKLNLKVVIDKAYRDVFQKVVIQRASYTNLVNYFMQKYGLGETVARQAVDIFLMFCEKAGMELPIGIDRTESPRSRPSTAPKVNKSTTKNPNRMPQKVETDSSGTYEIKMGKIYIRLPEGDTDSAFEAIQLINMYIKRLERANNLKLP